jgi:hypothetical protein
MPAGQDAVASSLVNPCGKVRSFCPAPTWAWSYFFPSTTLGKKHAGFWISDVDVNKDASQRNDLERVAVWQIKIRCYHRNTKFSSLGQRHLILEVTRCFGLLPVRQFGTDNNPYRNPVQDFHQSVRNVMQTRFCKAGGPLAATSSAPGWGWSY